MNITPDSKIPDISIPPPPPPPPPPSPVRLPGASYLTKPALATRGGALPPPLNLAGGSVKSPSDRARDVGTMQAVVGSFADQIAAKAKTFEKSRTDNKVYDSGGEIVALAESRKERMDVLKAQFTEDRLAKGQNVQEKQQEKEEKTSAVTETASAPSPQIQQLGLGSEKKEDTKKDKDADKSIQGPRVDPHSKKEDIKHIEEASRKQAAKETEERYKDAADEHRNVNPS